MLNKICNFNKKYILAVILSVCLLLETVVPSWAMMSIEQEKALGRRLLLMVRSKVNMINDPETVLYITGLGHKILKQVGTSFFQYHFFVIDDDALNAFAMPGGYVFVYSGLIEEVDSEDELICVMAHEIGHVEGRHIVRRLARMQKVNLATMALAIAGLFLGSGQATSAVFATSTALNIAVALKYSREDEEEADRRAYHWACEAGYDPRGLAYILQKMQRYRWLGSSSIPGYLETHPGTPDRINYIEDLYHDHPCPQRVKPNTFELHRVQIRLQVLTQDPVVLAEKYKNQLRSKPHNVMLRFGLAFALQEQQDYRGAIKIFKQLAKQYPERPIFISDLANAYLHAGDYTQAISLFRGYVFNHPKNLVARYDLALAYLRSGDAKDAMPLFLSLLSRWPIKTNLYLNLGLALSKLHQMGMAHFYFCKHFIALGQMQAAMYHRRIALKLLPKSSIYYQYLMHNMGTLRNN